MLPKAGSLTQFELIRLWLRNCNEGFLHKCKPRLDVKLPTRVIDVGVDDSSNIRLCEQEEGKDTRYIALSHRWGRNMFKTLLENINDRKMFIQHECLPRNFQHAIAVTRALNIRYLWIDSICIIQDDPNDWKRESALMEEVFSSAYCTIAATNAPYDGLLNDRTNRTCVRLKNPTYNPIFICEYIDDFDGDVQKAELNKRGWVFQERVLSRRTIYFTKHQVYWECGESIRCETLTKMQKYTQ